MEPSKIEEYIKQLESEGKIVPDCNGCQEFYSAIRNGREIWEVYAPSHIASPFCKSGKYNHCTCDTCF